MAFPDLPIFTSHSRTITLTIHIQFKFKGVLSMAHHQWMRGVQKNYRAIFYYYLPLIWQNIHSYTRPRQPDPDSGPDLLCVTCWKWNDCGYFRNTISCFVEVCTLRACGVYYPNKIPFNHILNTPLEALARIMFLMRRDLWCAPSLPFCLLLRRWQRSCHFDHVPLPCAPNQISVSMFDSQCARCWRFLVGFSVIFSVHSRVIVDLVQSSICSVLYSI